jgi:plastocyanin
VTAVVHTVLAASEPSKVPFYLVGGVLVAWAVILSAIGLSRADFPGSPGRARAVMAISAVLVVGTVTSAVLTSSTHHHEAAAKGPEPVPAAGPPPAGGKSTLQVTADPTGQLKYEQTTLSASPGQVQIVFDNPSPVDHNVTITDGTKAIGATKTIAKGKTTAVVALRPGNYVFFCSVDAHRQAGMEGKLVVS